MILTIYFRAPAQTSEGKEWLAILPQGPVTARAPTREAARTLVLQRALQAIAGYLERGRLTFAAVFPLEVIESEEQVPIEELGRLALQESPGLQAQAESLQPYEGSV
jgi:hypothetical protein